jgi:predicted  nucleic acid-binding Zn-ribbon protein
MGSHGSQYRGVCPKDLEPAFLKAYHAGKKVHIASQRLKTLQNKQNTQQSELQTVKTQLKAKEGLLISSQGGVAQRALLLMEIKELNHRSGELGSKIEQTDKELAAASAKLNQISSAARF